MSLALIDEMCTDQLTFPGIGKHTANDFLFRCSLWPGIPPCVLCSDDVEFQRFLDCYACYMSMWVSPEFRQHCAQQHNLGSAFAFNRWADLRYTRSYLWIFRKVDVSMPADLYNRYLSNGLLDPDHTIGQLFFRGHFYVP